MSGTALLRERAVELARLHREGPPLVLPNAWDVASARLVEAAGFPAVATSSSAVAASLGYPDGEVIPVDEMFAAVARIVRAVEVPVTADLEAGYGLPAGELIERLLAAGAVGMNIEDSRRPREGDEASEPMLPVTEAAARLAGIREAAAAAGVPVVLNARIDLFLRRGGAQGALVDEALARAREYLAAGANCIFPIFIAEEAIARIVAEVGAPVNVLLRAGVPPLDRLTALGVRRISFGGGLLRVANAMLEGVLRELAIGDAGAFQRR
jgi:2-methylisocitrate lyase-like PEP mutase family enzyme